MPTRRARLRRRIYRRLPVWLTRHDFEIFVSGLGLISGIPLLFGKVDAQSVQAILPRPVVEIWGAVLVIGCLAILIGVYQGTRHKYPERLFWMRVEVFGLTALAYYCYIFTICIWGFNFKGGWSASMIILAFGATCHVREVVIQMDIERYRQSLGLQERE